MYTKGLLEALKTLPIDENSVRTPQARLRPGYFSVLAAYLKRKKIPENKVFLTDKQQTYSKTIMLQDAVWQSSGSTMNRPNLGKSYSPIVHLCSPEAVDKATGTINDCLRSMTDPLIHGGLSDLFSVIGELHDNVWSHGKNSGFSTAQKNNNKIEFCLADCGLGLLGELKSNKLDVANTHEQAISWCIQKGNSSKIIDSNKEDDEWAQALPNDFTGSSPFGKNVKSTYRNDGNNHQGLGLAKLIELVDKYNAELVLATGDSALTIDMYGNRTNITLPYAWEGVAISILICCNKLSEKTPPQQNDDINTLIGKLRGQS